MSSLSSIVFALILSWAWDRVSGRTTMSSSTPRLTKPGASQVWMLCQPDMLSSPV